jgi:hypothetical protein
MTRFVLATTPWSQEPISAVVILEIATAIWIDTRASSQNYKEYKFK